MLDRNTLLTRFSFVESSLNKLRQLAQLSAAEFLADDDNFHLGWHHLRLAAEAATDMGRHIIARMGWRQPHSYKDVFTILGQHGVLSRALASRLENLADFRNILTHRYVLVTPQEIYQRVQRHVPDLEDFCTEMAAYLQSQGIAP